MLNNIIENLPNKKLLSKNGFTLLEVLMAVFILTVGVLGAFALIQNIIIHSQVASSRLTATYLVQEGIEKVRNERDGNWLSGSNWNDDLSSGMEAGVLGKFSRLTTIQNDGEDKVIVSVEVSWLERGRDHLVVGQTELYNWR